MEEKNVIVEKSLEFAVRIIRFCELLDGENRYVIGRQLLRSGTAIGANVYEAQHAESKADFVHKMKIAAKEANESNYWLAICEQAGKHTDNSSLKILAEELVRILSKIIISSKSTGKKL